MCTDISSLYGKIREEVDRRGFNVNDIPKDGDCALHAIIDLLRLIGQTGEHVHYTVATLCCSAIKLLQEHPVDINFFDQLEFDTFDNYLKQQSMHGTWCDELMLRRLSDVDDRKIIVINENGHETSIVRLCRRLKVHPRRCRKHHLF